MSDPRTLVTDPAIRPEWRETRAGVLVPDCADECPSYDGKRCRILGRRPHGLCEPAVEEIVAAGSADEERARVVAWLRGEDVQRESRARPGASSLAFAQAIESGRHRAR